MSYPLKFSRCVANIWDLGSNNCYESFYCHYLDGLMLEWIHFSTSNGSTPPELVEHEAGREPAGLPSTLLEPQGALLDEEQPDQTEGDTGIVSLLTNQLTKTKLEENEFSNVQVFIDFTIFCLFSCIVNFTEFGLPQFFLHFNSFALVTPISAS